MATTENETTPLLGGQGDTDDTGDKQRTWRRRLVLSLESRILLGAFILSASLSLNQIPILYAFRTMVCADFYARRPLWSGVGDRCSRNEIEAGVATQYTCLGLTAIVCGLLNIVLAKGQINRWGLKIALLINIAFPILRSSVQAACVLVGGLPGIILMHASQVLAIIGGSGGGILILNIIISETTTPSGAQTAAIGKLTGSTMFGSAVGYQMGGIIGNQWDIQAPFLVSAGCLVLTFTYVISLFPSIPPSTMIQEDTILVEARTKRKGLPFKFPTILNPQSRIAKDGKTVRYNGPMLLAAGTFAWFVGTGNLLALMTMHAGAVFHFSPTQNSTLMTLNSLVRSVFLLFLFPRAMACGHSWYARKKTDVGAFVTGADLEHVQDTDVSTETDVARQKERSVAFDLSVLRWSVLLDAVLTGSNAFTKQSWQIYLVGALQPLASGVVPTSKGVMLQICSPDERANALQLMAMIEYLATFATVAVFGFVYSFLAQFGKGYLTFLCTSSMAIVAGVILFFCRPPPREQ